MSWFKEFKITIFCDDCSKFEQRGGSNVNKVRKRLEQKGWAYKDGKDLCSECKEAYGRKSSSRPSPIKGDTPYEAVPRNQ